MLEHIIPAAASIIGGLFNKSSADDTRAATQAIADRNIALQKEFAQNGIQWRVEDAKKAGIHPIYALGGSGASFSPVSANFSADTSLGSAFAQAGQDLGRSIQATRSAPDRAVALQANKLALEGQALDNDLKREELASKIARVGSSQVGPPMPMATVPGYDPVPLPVSDPRKVAPFPVKKTETTSDLKWRGWSWKNDPHTSPAESWEDRYGDDISFATAPLIGAADLMYNNARKIEFYQDLMRRAFDYPPRPLPARRGYNPHGVRQGRR